MIINDAYTIDCLRPYFPEAVQPQIVAPCEISAEQIISLATASAETSAEGIANALKIGVEHSSNNNPELAFQLADMIVGIGAAVENGSLIGLGTMAQGDILSHTGRYLEAWDKLHQAGEIYLQTGDEFGWARTRIGRLQISPELDAAHVEAAFDDARRAEAIFLKVQRHDRLLRLYHAWASGYDLMGHYEEAIAYYQKAVEIAEQHGDSNSEIMIAYLHSDMGTSYNNLGELRAAMDHLTRARRVLLDAHLDHTAAMTEFSMANNHVIRGEYRQALHLLLNSVLPNLHGHRADSAQLTVIDCYLALNRDQEAYELAREIVSASQHNPDRAHQTALSALFLATAQTRLGQFSEAQQSLDLAEANFAAYENMVTLIQLRRGQVALRQGDFEAARALAHGIAPQFWNRQQSMNWINATLLEAEAALSAGALNDAQNLSYRALKHARDQELPPACYRCCVVLGQILERQGKRHSSARLYQAALNTLRDIQRSLTISLRPDFLEDKLLPFRRLMELYLSDGKVEIAFRTLEQLKSQVFQDYLTQRERLHWVENEQTRPLLDELRGLRDRYHWLTHRQSEPPVDEAEGHSGTASELNVQAALADCQKRIRQITEKLYLFSALEPRAAAETPALSEIQRRLDDDTCLLEFYADREHMWCIAATRDSACAYPLSASATEIQELIEDKWISNLEFALEAGPDDRRTQVLTAKAHKLSERLYRLLLEPMAHHFQQKRRLVIIPYGFLHQLPFNILRHDERYLIETHELLLLPSASLLLRLPPMPAEGATVMAHSWGGRLSFSLAEAEMVHQFVGGAVFVEQAANHELLHRPPSKVLHISAHGEHRIDQPDFAYLELGDGPIYTDDLLQYNLSYELVVLSACEIGRAKVTAGDELIGLGRGFLYAGAGALITSLWRVNEQHTYQLMESLYRALGRGASKAEALRAAQCDLLAQNANLHPAFWAAFQLICNADPFVAA
ncbi:MAG TPA: CHAT domain-containing protein [Phototrophicaceae bacterium]|nr:CHAT domain-containing protein [Phototrophicaceae bacterium]